MEYNPIRILWSGVAGFIYYLHNPYLCIGHRVRLLHLRNRGGVCPKECWHGRCTALRAAFCHYGFE